LWAEIHSATNANGSEPVETIPCKWHGGVLPNQNLDSGQPKVCCCTHHQNNDECGKDAAVRAAKPHAAIGHLHSSKPSQSCRCRPAGATGTGRYALPWLLVTPRSTIQFCDVLAHHTANTTSKAQHQLQVDPHKDQETRHGGNVRDGLRMIQLLFTDHHAVFGPKLFQKSGMQSRALQE
jgi:hypothetical protein